MVIGLLAVCGLLVALPVQPAVADWSVCDAQPATPFMIDHKLHTVDGASRTACNQELALVQAKAKLDMYVSRVGAWETVSTGEMTQARISYVWADAYIGCKGMGEVAFRSQGWGKGIAWTGGSWEDDWDTSEFRILNCGGEGGLHDIINP
jgi:hypothetical protein